MITAPTPRLSPLDRALLALEKMEAKLLAAERTRTEPIAVVGIGCRFPGGGEGPDGYWQRLLAGVDGVVEIPASRWPEGATAEDPPSVHPGTRWAGLLEDVASFDADFFGMSPREVMSLDPQHRLLLEVAWEALEDAGVPTAGLLGSRTGVYIGATTQDYQTQISSAGLEHLDAYTAIGNGLCFAAGRLSYVLGLQGPSMTIDTACSSSLVATHLAVASLRAGECDLGLAGGVNLILSPIMMAMMARTHALSPDGRCKTFDARANGIARGEGCGVVVLKRLSDAARDGDHVWAVIRGSAVNQDGRSTGMTTPNVLAQQALLRQALAGARVDASRIGYVEAHGTGTSLGDPIEVEALKAVLGEPRADGIPCALGAVKTNLGHLEAAAGVAGLVKVILALKHGLIPRNLHFEALNPRISLEGTPFVIPTSTLPFPAAGGLRAAGLSSFGLSGTNAHLVLEEAPAPPARSIEPPAGRVELTMLSARSPGALTELASRWHDRIAGSPELELYDIAWASGVKRSHLGQRLAIAARDREGLLRALDSARRGLTAPGLTQGEAVSDRPRVVFVFPGQGSQWLGMGRQLYEADATFRATLDRCDAAVSLQNGWSILRELHADAAASRFDQIEVVQPLLFSMSIALAALWRSWGVEPDAVVGHSMGEIAASCVAGALSLDDATAVICRRSRLLKRAVGLGAMAIAELSLEETSAAILGYEGRVAVAGSNSPQSTLLSGELAALEELSERFARREIFFRIVRAPVPSHSPKVAFLEPDLLAELSGIQPRAGEVPIHSTVTGEGTDGADQDARYWVRNLLEPVRFSQCVQRLAADGHRIFIEVSAHPVLLGPLQQTLAGLEVSTRALGSLRREQDEPLTMVEALGTAYAAGFPVDPRRRMPAPGIPVSLPTYPWQRARHWIDLRPSTSRRGGRPPVDPAAHPLLTSAFSSSAHAGSRFWEVDLSMADLPWLRDHAVQETALMPAAGYVEMAQAAAVQAWGPGAHQVESVELRQVLSLREDETRRVQLVLTEDGPGRVGFQVSSRVASEDGAGAAGWLLHARGAVRAASMLEDPAAPPFSADEIRARCPEELTAEAHQEQMAAMALRYGPTFQGIQRLWRRPGEVLGQLALPAALAHEASRYGVHPALLDALLQLLAASFTGEASLPANSTYLPVRIGSVRLFRRPEGELWGHARLSTWPGADVVSPGGDVTLHDASGALVLEARGLAVQRLESIQRVKDPDAALLYELRWDPAPPLPAPAAPPRGAWLVLTEGALGEALARRLT